MVFTGHDLFDDLTSFHPWKPPVDIYETQTRYVLQVEVPGVEKNDLQLRVQGNRLEIAGERKFDSICAEDHYHQLESFHGRFKRSFSFPGALERDSVTARLQNGILTIQLPKAAARERHIQVGG